MGTHRIGDAAPERGVRFQPDPPSPSGAEQAATPVSPAKDRIPCRTAHRHPLKRRQPVAHGASRMGVNLRQNGDLPVAAWCAASPRADSPATECGKATTSAFPGSNRAGISGERGIRYLDALVESVTHRFHVAPPAIFANRPVDHSTLLHAGSACTNLCTLIKLPFTNIVWDAKFGSVNATRYRKRMSSGQVVRC